MPAHHDPAIDATFVRRLVADQFPDWAALAVTPVPQSGWDNHSFRLGDDKLVRLPSADRYAAQADKEQRWLPRLAGRLSVPIPIVLASGRPTLEFRRRWSVYGWIAGETASDDVAGDAAFGADLARFLVTLNAADAADGPVPGAHNFHRGGSLAVYDGQARKALAAMYGHPLAPRAQAVWAEALSSVARDGPTWLHGDFAPLNLLVRGGRRAAVIDWGSSGVGDPACDLALAWTFLRGPGRQAFAAGLPFDGPTWKRGRGWALWKAMILATGVEPGPAVETARAWRTMEEILIAELPGRDGMAGRHA